jgi:hypothetical protein
VVVDLLNAHGRSSGNFVRWYGDLTGPDPSEHLPFEAVTEEKGIIGDFATLAQAQRALTQLRRKPCAEDIERLPVREDQAVKAGQTKTPAFRRWFRNSKVVDAQGEPLVVYHGHRDSTPAFDTFDMRKSASIGMHFGTEAAAQHRDHVRAFYLSIQNPLRLPDPGDWLRVFPRRGLPATLSELFRAGVIGARTLGQAQTQLHALDTAHENMEISVEDYQEKASTLLRGLIERKGYDGVVYENRIEDRGSTSWIAFRPTQIKSVDNVGTFNPADPRIERLPVAPGLTAQRQHDFDQYAEQFHRWIAGIGYPAVNEERAEIWGQSLGLRFVGMGRNRVAFGVPEGVLKLNLYADEPYNNLSEAKAWGIASPDLRRHLMPVLAYDPKGLWLLMEETEFLGGSLPPGLEAKLEDCGLEDLVGENIAEDGRIIDYAEVNLGAWASCARASQVERLPVRGQGSRVQSLIFDKAQFTKAEARDWARKHGFRAPAVDEKPNTLRLRQIDPADMQKGTFGTIRFRPGVQAVVAVPLRALPAPSRPPALRPSGRPSVVERLATPLPSDLAPNDPGLLTVEEYLARQNQQGKYHSAEIWDRTVAEMNAPHRVPWDIAPRRWVDRERWAVAELDDHVLVFEHDGEPVAVVRDGTLYHGAWTPGDLPWYGRYPARGQDSTRFENPEKLPAVRVKYPAEHLKPKHPKALDRYPQVLRRLILGGEPLELRTGTKAQKAELGDSIAVLNADGLIVALASDEWGATLLQVAREYRGRGLGVELGRAWYAEHPRHVSGGYTAAGEKNAVKMWATRVRDFLSRGWYSELVQRGQISAAQVQAILAGLEDQPKTRGVLPEKPTAGKNQVSVSAADLLFYVDPGMSFTIYDRRFLAEPGAYFIYAHGFMRSSDSVGAFFFKLDYAPQFARLATVAALQLARDDGKTKLYVGPGYGDILELDKLDAKAPIRRKGDYIWLLRDALPLAELGRLEARTRKDPYGQVLATLAEEAEGKSAQDWLDTKVALSL